MDREMVLEHFRLAARHVRQGIVHVQNQRSLIVDLKAHGRDSAEAIWLLTKFEEMLELHQADLKRLQKALAEAGAADG